MYLGKKMLAVPLVNDTKTSKTASKRSFQVITLNIIVGAIRNKAEMTAVRWQSQ